MATRKPIVQQAAPFGLIFLFVLFVFGAASVLTLWVGRDAPSPYFYGALALIALYSLSWAVTRHASPFALALGHNGKLSTSLFQNFAFTAVVAFAYVTAIALRTASGALALPTIPLNLLVLMGLSVTTAAASQGITIAYLQQGALDEEDQSSLTQNRDGRQDLSKVQMLIFTLIAVGVYMVTFVRFVGNGCYGSGPTMALCGTGGVALPDIDAALLVLMGVVQGGYLGSKLVNRSSGAPGIEHFLPNRAVAGSEVSLEGVAFGVTKVGSTVIFKDESGLERAVDPALVLEWTDTKIRFTIPALPIGKYDVRVRAGTQTGQASPFEIV